MGLKDDIRQRRQDKIRKLMQQSKFEDREKTTGTSQSRLASAEFQNKQKQDPIQSIESRSNELDPERAWKKHPNPWAAWGNEEERSPIRSFVKGAGTANESAYPSHTKHSFRKEMQWKLVISLLLFGFVWVLFHYNNEWTLKGQAIVKQALTDEIDFAAAAAWYKETFAGAPSFIPIFENKPSDAIGVDGIVKQTIALPLKDGVLVRTFAELLNGIELAGPSETEVVAAETGKVILVTEERNRIMIQHANKRVTVYGGLGEAAVKVNDWVETGDRIGKLRKTDGGMQSLLYFAVKEDDRYVDPMGVISLD